MIIYLFIYKIVQWLNELQFMFCLFGSKIGFKSNRKINLRFSVRTKCYVIHSDYIATLMLLAPSVRVVEHDLPW